MQKYALLLILGFLFFTISSSVFAETTTNSNEFSDTPARISKPLRPNKAQEAERKENREKKEQLMEKKEMKIASREANLKERLNTFTNKEKAQRTIAINNSFKTINQNRTAEMQKILTKFTEIVVVLEQKIQELETNGKNVTVAKTNLEAAKTAVEDARIAVDTQTAKDYTIVVSNEDIVKSDIKATRDTLFNDLKNTQGTLNVARNALKTAFESVKTVVGKIELINE